MHSQGRGLNSGMMNHLDEDIDTYTLREAEFSCTAIVGVNFGDGHLHDHRLIRGIQKRCHFAPGEFTVVWVASEPVRGGRQHYWVMDAAVGPIAVEVEWRLERYERVNHSGVLPVPVPVAHEGASAPDVAVTA